MDLRKLKTLIDLVSESNISELEITEADGKVRIVKSEPQAGGTWVAQAPSTGSQGSGPLASPQVAVAAASPVEDSAAPVVAARVIKSPMVGTFYRSASPGGKPMVDVGSSVKAGEAVCIIEAMKIMNEIEADMEGTIARVLVDNGQAVEFGQPLFALE